MHVPTLVPHKTLLCLLSLALPLAAQSIGDGVAVAASRSINLLPTQANISVSVTSSLTLEEAVAKLTDLGVALENLTSMSFRPGISTGIPGAPAIPATTTHTFTISSPLAQTGAYLQRFAAFSQSNPTLSPVAQVVSVSVAPTAFQEAAKKLTAELFQEAKARAQEVAAASGLKVGRVLSITDSYSAYSLTSYYLFASFQYPVSISVRFALEE